MTALFSDATGEMPVSALMADAIVHVPGDANLREVAMALVDADAGALVVGADDEVDAVVSERDLVRALAAGRDPETARAAEVASTKLVCADAAAPVGDVATLMRDQYVRHVLVEEDGRVVGIVSARDLLGVYAASDGYDDASRW